jgi:hypothetical protein
MPLENVSLRAAVDWTLKKTNTGFDSTAHGPTSKSFGLVPAVATFQYLGGVRYTVAGGGNQVVDLSAISSANSFTGESATLTKIIGLLVLPTGSGVKVEPHTTDGLSWFFSGTTPAVTVPADGCFFFAQPAAQTMSGTSKNFKFSNTAGGGGATLTLDLVFLGGT